LLLVAFSRWRVERCFEDQKSEIGLDQYEGRRYLGLKRHLILSCLSYLFLARMRQEWAGKKSGADGLPTAHRDGRIGPMLGIEVAPIEGESAGKSREKDRVGAEAERRGPQEPHQANPTKVTRTRHHAYRTHSVSMGLNLAL
jgi:hypothetical protein